MGKLIVNFDFPLCGILARTIPAGMQHAGDFGKIHIV
jgi:hypothetical protein